MELLVLFIGLSIVNVIFSTVRSLTTIKSGKTVAALISGGYFAYYNIVLLYTVADFPMWQKCIITFVCNVIGVWIVKYIEEKIRKDKLWKIEVTVIPSDAEEIIRRAKASNLSFNYVDINKWVLFNFYCATQTDTMEVENLLAGYQVKYFISETKSF